MEIAGLEINDTRQTGDTETVNSEREEWELGTEQDVQRLEKKKEDRCIGTDK